MLYATDAQFICVKGVFFSLYKVACLSVSGRMLRTLAAFPVVASWKRTHSQNRTLLPENWRRLRLAAAGGRVVLHSTLAAYLAIRQHCRILAGWEGAGLSGHNGVAVIIGCPAARDA